MWVLRMEGWFPGVKSKWSCDCQCQDNVTVDLPNQERPMAVCQHGHPSFGMVLASWALAIFESLRSKHQTEMRQESLTLPHGFRGF